MGYLTDIIDDTEDAVEDTSEAVENTVEDTSEAATDAVADTTGFTEWTNRDATEEAQEEFDSSDSRWEKLNVGTRAGMDFLLDNPEASVQDSVREAAKAPTEYIEDREVSDEELAGSVQDAVDAGVEAGDGAVDGTALDNPVTDGVVAGADLFFGSPARNAAEMVTGINPGGDDASVEGNVNFAEGAEVALSGFDLAPAARLATKGSKALADSNMIGGIATAGRGIVSKINKGDNLLAGVSRAGDDVAESVPRLSDDVAETASKTDGVNVKNGLIDDAIDSGTDAARGGDEVGDLARFGDDAARATDEVGSVLGTTGKAVLGGTAGVLGGGALLETAGAFDGTGENSGVDASDSPTPPEDDGSGTYMEAVAVFGDDSAQLFRVYMNGEKAGYSVFVGADSGVAQVLEGTESVSIVSSGVSTTAIENGSEVLEARYDTRSSAKAAFDSFVSSDSGNGGDDGTGSWTDWAKVQELSLGWFLFAREHTQNANIEYLAAATNESGSEVYLTRSGSTSSTPTIFDSTAAVKAALQKFAAKVERGGATRPTGTEPDGENVSKAGNEAATGIIDRVTEIASENPSLVLLSAVAVLIVVMNR